MVEYLPGLRTFTNEGRKAEELWYMILGYSETDAIDITNPTHVDENLRVVVMHGEWKDILFWNKHDDGEISILENELEKQGFDKDFYYYFLVGPSSEIESGNWENSAFYSDKEVVKAVENRGVIGNHMQTMPNDIYDLAWKEICRIYEVT